MSKGRSKDTSRLTIENALVVHWLGLHIFTALAWVQSLVQGANISQDVAKPKKKRKKKKDCIMKHTKV